MSYWAIVIFVLGLLALLFNLLGVFEWFVPVWSIVLMLVAFAMLARIAAKERNGEKEALRKSIEDLEIKLKGINTPAGPQPRL